MKAKHIFILNILILCIAFTNVNAQVVADTKESARVFVQQFYNWYNILYAKPVDKKHPVPACIIALNQKSAYFDLSLSKAISNDQKAQEKVVGDIVGLDFDPFLAAQDDGLDYQTGKVKQVGDKYFVDVHADLAGKSRATILASKVIVIAEVIKTQSGWKFINFIYPTDGKQDNLMDILKGLKQDRAKSTR